MNTPFPFLKPGAATLAVAVLVGLAADANAQINEMKVERDATGIYQGRASGARYRVTYDNDPSATHGGTVDPVSAKARVPVKDGRLSSGIRDNELPGTGRAVAKGGERRSTVTRGGKRVVVKAVGTMDLAEEPHKGIWKGGFITGNLDDRGAKWSANAKSGAYQRNRPFGSPPGTAPDHTKRVTGMGLRGRG